MNIWIPITVAFVEAAIVGLLIAWIAEMKQTCMTRGRITSDSITKGTVGPLVKVATHRYGDDPTRMIAEMTDQR